MKGTKMQGRTHTDRFQHLFPRLKRSNMYKLPEVHQRGSTVHTASRYGTNIIKRKTNKEPEEVKSKDGVIWRIWVSVASPPPPNPSKHSQVSLTEKKIGKIHFSEIYR